MGGTKKSLPNRDDPEFTSIPTFAGPDFTHYFFVLSRLTTEDEQTNEEVRLSLAVGYVHKAYL